MTSVRTIQTIDDLIHSGYITKQGNFKITEEVIHKFGEYYRLNGSFSRSWSPKNQWKLAGLTLIKLKILRGIKPKDINEGLLYIISNPAWPDHLKIGVSVDLKKRLSTYQTYDPFRSFKIDHYEFVLDRRLTEKKLLLEQTNNKELGEWIRCDDAKQLITKLKDTIDYGRFDYPHTVKFGFKLKVGDKVSFIRNYCVHVGEIQSTRLNSIDVLFSERTGTKEIVSFPYDPKMLVFTPSKYIKNLKYLKKCFRNNMPVY